ncbi:MFS transporter [Pseudomonas koreensis]|uniref:MFS transporter n=1 Tax=Pseudomonas koreensis TaxID=198620 RepID=UPI0021C8BFE2|nr:MFS transporter [Pseudomonas koreensis]MCU0069969.1 MFS transporter [Pseudomonas koreensis]
MLGETALERLSSAASTSSQWSVIGLCMLFNVIDGLDVMAMAFTASRVSAEWALSGAQLGALLSASLVGMAFGSLVAGPRADRFGRRPLLLAGLLLSGVGMLLSFWSPSHEVLLLLRLLTGIGTGAVLVGANVLTYEHASQHRRNLAIALQSLAFALGASLGGVLAHALNESAGWRYVFLSGGVITLAAALVGALWLRESPSFLALEQPAPGESAPRSYPVRELFAADQWQQTTSLALALFLLMFCFYFVMSWTPTLLIHNGFSDRQGARIGVLLAIGGVLGALLLGLAANRFGCRRLLSGFLLLNAVLLPLMMPATHVSGLSAPVAATLGLMLNGAVAALYVLTPQAFGTAVRTTGVGLVLGTGRLGAIVSPVVAGFLLDARWTAQDLFTFFAGSQVLAALLIWHGTSQRCTTEQ